MVWFHHEDMPLLLLRYNNVTVSQGFPATSSLVREPAQNGFSCAYQDVILHEVLLGYQEKMTSPVKSTKHRQRNENDFNRYRITYLLRYRQMHCLPDRKRLKSHSKKQDSQQALLELFFVGVFYPVCLLSPLSFEAGLQNDLPRKAYEAIDARCLESA